MNIDAGGGTIDERTGAYRGVRLGSRVSDVIRVFGEANRDPGFAPAGKSPAEVGVPQSISSPTGDPGALLKYEDVAFSATSETGVYAMIVTEQGATTSRGVSIGDDMSAARRRYRLRCIEVAGGESLLGEQEWYPSCGADIGNRVRIWFGRDPIESITLVSGTASRP